MTPVPAEGPRPGRWKRLALAGSAAVLVCAAAGLTLVVLIAAALASIGNSLTHVGERHHLKPIPISTRACPYVALMHAAANDFQAHEPTFGLILDDNGQPVPLAKERVIVDPPLARFEFAIAVSRPHFPTAVRSQLAITQDAAHQGRVLLAQASGPAELFNQSGTLLSRGQRAFGYASDLVGAQCGHGLGADSGTGSALFPVTTRARTVSRL